MSKEDETETVIEIIREALRDPKFRRWRMERYGKEVFMDDGSVYTIQPDGQLLLTYQPLYRRPPRR